MFLTVPEPQIWNLLCPELHVFSVLQNSCHLLFFKIMVLFPLKNVTWKNIAGHYTGFSVECLASENKLPNWARTVACIFQATSVSKGFLIESPVQLGKSSLKVDSRSLKDEAVESSSWVGFARAGIDKNEIMTRIENRKGVKISITEIITWLNGFGNISI